MEFLILGFFTGLSLILAIGAQNIFVIEQGLKKQHIFLVCFVCSISDLILIFLGIFLFHYFTQYFNSLKERLKKNGHKYYDEPYLRFKGTKYEQETFFVKDPNENILEIKTLTANAD